jgi:F-type H+-transporting ATPase subunit gamma
MPSIKDLRTRITSTKSTQATTKAMKLVSAAKLRRAQEAITSQRPYAKAMQRLMAGLAAGLEKVESPYIAQPVTGSEKKRVTLVLLTSDRGLCGSFNSSVIKAAQRWITENEDNYSEIRLEFIGRRGNDFFRYRPVKKGRYYEEAGGKVTFAKARSVSKQLLADFDAGLTDEIKFVFNEFKNAVSQKVVVEDFLPVRLDSLQAAKEEQGSMTIVKPSEAEVFNQLLEKNFPIQVYRFLLESQAGEHGARMSAMENATKNAGEMIRKLSLMYNRQRQAGITKELLEIIAGSESQTQAS